MDLKLFISKDDKQFPHFARFSRYIARRQAGPRVTYATKISKGQRRSPRVYSGPLHDHRATVGIFALALPLRY